MSITIIEGEFIEVRLQKSRLGMESTKALKVSCKRMKKRVGWEMKAEKRILK